MEEYIALAHLAAAKFWRRVWHGKDPQPLRIGAEEREETTVGAKFARLWWGETSQVRNNLFLGSAVNAAAAHDFDLVVNVTEDVPNFYESTESVQYLRVPMRDVPDAHFDTKTLSAAADTVIDALGDGKRVLVHCLFGASRSVAVVCAVVRRMEGIDAGEAYASVREKRAEACMNVSFYEDVSALSTQRTE
jgi:protein-tyrosine phosphatase